MTINIGGTSFDSVTELDIKRELRRTDVRYNTNGDMLIDLVSRKYALSVTFGLLSEREMAALRALSGEIFVPVTFESPEGLITRDFHISDEPAPVATTVNGVTMYSGAKMRLLQK